MADSEPVPIAKGKDESAGSQCPRTSPSAATTMRYQMGAGSVGDDDVDSIDDDDLTPDSAAIEWIRSKIIVSGFDAYSDSEWAEEFEMTISDFLASPLITRLLIWRRDDGEMELATNLVIGSVSVSGSGSGSVSGSGSGSVSVRGIDVPSNLDSDSKSKSKSKS